MRGDDRATARALVAIAGTAALLLLFWSAGHVLLTIFAGVLLGILLHGMAHWLSEHSFLSDGWALSVVVVALVVILGVGGWLLVPQVAAQLDQLSGNLATAGESVRQYLSQYSWGRSLLDMWSQADLGSNLDRVVGQVMGVAWTTLGIVGTTAIILFIGIYIAIDPGLYQWGIVRLLPRRHRARANEVLEQTAQTLRRWLLGRAASMLVVGVVSAVGLWLLDIPLALTLGLVAGLLDFIPNIGPLIAGAIAVLVAFAEGSTQAFYVLLLYVGIQAVEGYLLTPLIQQRAVSLPPVLLLSVQILFGLFYGGLGLALATPLAAVALVVTQMVYIEDILGDRGDAGRGDG